MRTTRRIEKAQPIRAAKSRATTLPTMRPAEMLNGMPPAGMAASSSTLRSAPMVPAMTVTTTACTTTPPKSVRVRAPMALSTP